MSSESLDGDSFPNILGNVGKDKANCHLIFFYHRIFLILKLDHCVSFLLIWLCVCNLNFKL